MKRLFLLCITGVLIASCNPDTVDLSATGSMATTRTADREVIMPAPDSSAIINLAMAPVSYADLGTHDGLGITVSVPVIPDDYIEPAGLVQQFTELAKFTGGETNYVAAAREITKTFIGILDTHLVDNSDIVFMIDGTSSMFDDIENVKRGVTTIIKHVQMHQDVRVGVAVYRDVSDGPQSWYQHLPLTDDYNAVIAYVNSIAAAGGGWDWEESVYDAAALTIDTMEWRSGSQKMLLLLGDAPGLLGNRTTHTLEDVVVKSKEHGVDMNFYPVIITTSLPVDVTPVVTTNPIMLGKVFPNPSAGDVTVELNAMENYSWQVTDLAGGVLQENAGFTNKIQLDLSSLPNGVYMIKVIHDGATESKMIVVSH